MTFQEYFPIWKELPSPHQNRLLQGLREQTVKKGTILHNGNRECVGLFLIRSGQLRVYVLSEEGREITLYRHFERDICLLSASCMMRSLQFEVTVQAEKETNFWVIPTEVYQSLMRDSALIANYTNELMASRFSEVMWLMEQVMWKSLDKRVAEFLLQEAFIEGTYQLKITHEAIAHHLGSHREVITRMLRYFQRENVVKLSRGMVTILDESKLLALKG